VIAPSEKHLEDWIVANPDKVYARLDDPNEYWDGTVDFISRIVKRQCNLPSGRCDLIALATGMRDYSLAAIELKRDALDTKTVAQCLRYIRDLKEIFLKVRYPGLSNIPHAEPVLHYAKHDMCDNLLANNSEISGLIIGYDVPDENLLVACECADIQVLTYDYSEGDYSFDLYGTGDYIARAEVYENFAYGAIGDAMRSVIKNRYEREQFARRREEQS
jgi:hypothetical protein